MTFDSNSSNARWLGESPRMSDSVTAVELSKPAPPKRSLIPPITAPPILNARHHPGNGSGKPRASSAQGGRLPFVETVDEPPQTLVQRVQRSLPSCLSSFLFHLVLIVAMALLYVAPPSDCILVVSTWGDYMQPDAGQAVDLSVTFEAATLNQEMSLAELPPTEMLPVDGLPPVVDAMVESFAGSRYAEAFFLSMTGISGSGIDQRAVAVGDSAETAVGATQFFGLGGEGRRFVFVIDRSGSMYGMRWELAKQELLRCVERMSEEQEFFVLLYSSDTVAMWNQPLKGIKLVPATPENFQKLYQWLSQVYPAGMTRPREAMRIALELDPDAIFLLSDGEIQDDTYEFLLANNHPRTRNGVSAKIPIHTIALDYTLGALYLQNIARTNNGKFSQKFSQ